MLGIIGSRTQAGSHLEALRLVRQFEEVRVRSPCHSEAFARQFSVRAMSSAEETVRGADVVVTATISRTPVLSGEWLSPGVHVDAGEPRPDWRELDDETLHRTCIYVDSREALPSRNRGTSSPQVESFEVGEVVVGAKPGHQSVEEITLFKSLGLVVEDVATAGLIYRKAINTTTDTAPGGLSR